MDITVWMESFELRSLRSHGFFDSLLAIQEVQKEMEIIDTGLQILVPSWICELFLRTSTGEGEPIMESPLCYVGLGAFISLSLSLQRRQEQPAITITCKHRAPKAITRGGLKL